MSKLTLTLRFLATVVVINAISLAILVKTFGSNQIFTPRDMKDRLWLGMTSEEVAYEFGIPPLEINKFDADARKEICTHGIGCLFVTQYDILLSFSKNQLSGVRVNLAYGIDNRTYDMHLDRQRSKE